MQTFTIVRDNDELDLQYNIRKKFINDVNPKSFNEFKLALLYSYIYVNINDLGCSYSKEVNNKLIAFLDKLNNSYK